MKKFNMEEIKLKLKAFLERQELENQSMAFVEPCSPGEDDFYSAIDTADRQCASYSDSKYNDVKDELNKFLSDKPTKETLFDLVERHLQAKGMKPSEVYRKAQISKQDFSRYVRPNVETINRSMVFNLAIGLMLDSKETKQLLRSAGFGFNKKSKFDLILIFCIDNEIYDVTFINMLLEDFEQPLLKTYYYKED